MTQYFSFSVRGEVSVSVDDIWPDGDAPENPTAADVQREIDKSRDLATALLYWNLDEDLELVAAGPFGSKK
jgi:hypothetical protein